MPESPPQMYILHKTRRVYSVNKLLKIKRSESGAAGLTTRKR